MRFRRIFTAFGVICRRAEMLSIGSKSKYLLMNISRFVGA